MTPYTLTIHTALGREIRSFSFEAATDDEACDRAEQEACGHGFTLKGPDGLVSGRAFDLEFGVPAEMLQGVRK